MKNLLAVLLLVALGVVGIGFYRDWFKISTSSTDHKVQIEMTVDKNKVKEDKDKAKQKVEETGQQIKEKTDELTGKVKSDADSSKPADKKNEP